MINPFIALILLASSSSSSAKLRWVAEKKPEATSAIVFLHGFFGDSKDTWTNSETDFYVPKFIASEPILRSSQILTFEYPSKCHGVTASEAANKLISEISDSYPKVKTISLVTHSFGGVVARQFILRTKLKIDILINLATPNLGSELADYAALVERTCNIRNVSDLVTGREGYIDKLNDQWVRDMEQINEKRRNYEICSAYENEPMLKPFRVLTLVVPKDSASLFAQNTIYFSANHIGIAKPRGINDEIYTWILNRLTSKTCQPQNISETLQPVRAFGSTFSLWLITQNPLESVDAFIDQFGRRNFLAAEKIATGWKNSFFKSSALMTSSQQMGNIEAAQKYAAELRHLNPNLAKYLSDNTNSQDIKHPIDWNKEFPAIYKNELLKSVPK